MQTLTHSRLRSFRKCPRHHKLRYLDGWAPVQVSEALSFGRSLHLALESYWNNTPLPVLEDARAAEVMAAYQWPDRDDYDVLAVEKQIRFPLINPDTMKASVTFEMASVLDLLLRRRSTGETILIEHKTTGADFSDDAADYWRRLAMDAQLSIYVVAAESATWKVDRIIYDVIARPLMRPYKATPLEARKYTKAGALYANQRGGDESPEDFRERLRADIAERPERYYGRREIARTESELLEGMRDVWQEARAIRDAELAGRHPRNPDACHQYSTCEFYEICALGVDPETSSLYVRKPIHEELA